MTNNKNQWKEEQEEKNTENELGKQSNAWLDIAPIPQHNNGKNYNAHRRHTQSNTYNKIMKHDFRIVNSLAVYINRVHVRVYVLHLAKCDTNVHTMEWFFIFSSFLHSILQWSISSTVCLRSLITAVVTLSTPSFKMAINTIIIFLFGSPLCCCCCYCYWIVNDFQTLAGCHLVGSF